MHSAETKQQKQRRQTNECTAGALFRTGAVLLFLLKLVGILLLIGMVLLALVLFCPFCADVQWEQGVFTVKAGALGLAFPVFQYPKPQPTEPEEPKGPLGKLKAKFRAWRAERKAKKAAAKQQNLQTQKETISPQKANLPSTSSVRAAGSPGG